MRDRLLAVVEESLADIPKVDGRGLRAAAGGCDLIRGRQCHCDSFEIVVVFYTLLSSCNYYENYCST